MIYSAIDQIADNIYDRFIDKKLEFPTKAYGVKAQSNIHKKNPKKYIHIFTQKWKKVKSKPFSHC